MKTWTTSAIFALIFTATLAWAGGDWPFPFAPAPFEAERVTGCYNVNATSYQLCLRPSSFSPYLQYHADLIDLNQHQVVAEGELQVADGALGGRLREHDGQGAGWFIQVAFLNVHSNCDSELWASLERASDVHKPFAGAMRPSKPLTGN